jgi:hypothetical protein
MALESGKEQQPASDQPKLLLVPSTKHQPRMCVRPSSKDGVCDLVRERRAEHHRDVDPVVRGRLFDTAI